MSWDAAWIGVTRATGMVSISAVVSLCLAACLALVYAYFSDRLQWRSYARIAVEFFAIAFPFGVVGITSGFLTGNSRLPAVSALVPAFLTLFGALIAYLMSQGLRSALLAGIAVVTFSTALLVGVVIGSLERQEFDAARTSLEERLADLERELVVRNYRKSLGLPEEPTKQNK